MYVRSVTNQKKKKREKSWSQHEYVDEKRKSFNGKKKQLKFKNKLT